MMDPEKEKILSMKIVSSKNPKAMLDTLLKSFYCDQRMNGKDCREEISYLTKLKEAGAYV